MEHSGGDTTESIAESEELASLLNEKKRNRGGGSNQRLAIMLGMLTKDGQILPRGNIPSKDRSKYSLQSYAFTLEAPFEISNKCCDVMKKDPAHKYEEQTKRVPITAQMAEESHLRTQKWIQHGCNMFDAKRPKSNPMSFWTEQDVLQYIRDNNLEICSVYGKVVTDDEEMGQISFASPGNEKYHCTGCQRTGCILCCFGAHLEKEGNQRLVSLRQTHPKMYQLLDICQNNGYTYRQAIDWIGQHSDKIIRY